ncbi:MAG: class I SAM-dependent methyltransferase [Candidatus Poseidoniales archaeon]
MGLKKATDVFSEWAKIGKDVGMEEGHAASVSVMLEQAIHRMEKPFKAIDIGCGNGWVVRKLLSFDSCVHATGIDGAEEMIAKARDIDPEGEYVHAQLPGWIPEEKFDLVMSMEFMYYLENPKQFLRNISTDWIASGGWLIFGIDHYTENESSHSWPEKLNVHMTTMSEEEWQDSLREIGFENVISLRAGAKDGWAGTLILVAQAR